MRPRILQTDDRVGFHWLTPQGAPTTLRALVLDDDEPATLAATHLSALDDALIDAAGRFGQVLGGGRRPSSDEWETLGDLYRSLDRSCLDYADAIAEVNVAPDVRAGKIIGTAVLVSIFARQALGLLGPVPLEGELDEPTLGVVGGYGELVQVDPDKPWKGGRWVVRTETGVRLPLTLSMLLFDSSGVNKDAARREHRELIQTVVAASSMPQADPLDVASALDWLLYDWLMAHRTDPDSAEIVMVGDTATQNECAAVIVAGAAASVRARASIDPGLMMAAP
jgi:hypothetical protein